MILGLVGFVLVLLSPLIANLIKLAISRKREFLADASGVAITKNPSGLISALSKISQDQEPLEAANKATAHLYISDPSRIRRVGWGGLPDYSTPILQSKNELLPSNRSCNNHSLLWFWPGLWYHSYHMSSKMQPNLLKNKWRISLNWRKFLSLPQSKKPGRWFFRNIAGNCWAPNRPSCRYRAHSPRDRTFECHQRRSSNSRPHAHSRASASKRQTHLPGILLLYQELSIETPNVPNSNTKPADLGQNSRTDWIEATFSCWTLPGTRSNSSRAESQAQYLPSTKRTGACVSKRTGENHWQASPWRSKTTLAPLASPPPLHPRYSMATYHNTNQQLPKSPRSGWCRLRQNQHGRLGSWFFNRNLTIWSYTQPQETLSTCQVDHLAAARGSGRRCRNCCTWQRKQPAPSVNQQLGVAWWD